MKQLCCSCLLWLGLLLAPFSQEQEEVTSPTKLCGRDLLVEVIKLCGQNDWSRFSMEEQSPMTELVPQYTRKVKTFNPHRSSSSWGRFTNPGVSQKKATHTWESQSLPNYQLKKEELLPKTGVHSYHGGKPYVKSVKFQKKNTDKMSTFSGLFWGNHPQRKRRGFADKCCAIGCSKEELAVACLPFVDF
ncbi:insulin-like 6 [Rattus norvegicus]|uniref:Insulin-like peptide INSL6 n=2 Tax=Rattus norvegicus TaxID=10116 RepID=INSL6_RAT|nr:insulin-like peptide INSL6 precursor [Rattus norvegicus]Q9WV41.1 RecName: Full=Insulin-like peptide INSL6; Short=Insulin-like peptide 6; Contains: RecName: Full=Insulin-like peptide INSL6 B chain; Contains: RecName: Full=Insulin-like peptide INSL6 A chain; Flags: Precursor [Rattus norvegicus]AAD40956.1 insulin-like protein 6 [Rattus norvegicus]EDM13088.1 insulin-like 6 [Rattus norvegicus]|eukprot:NP_072105.1 insulin-like peptide INSL6 precursor [Rattus norvegicus]